ncbi:histidine kinase [Streptomyces sp. NPDC047985]|uniref:sensor histidine kinase n=1 Tax=Streptomyces sp. NPDC047985 TaxID=3155384 RepID=UPI00343962A3
MQRWGFVLLVGAAAVCLLPATIIMALVSLPSPDGIVITMCAAAAHASLLALRRAPTRALLLIVACTAVEAAVTGLFVLFPSTLLVPVALHGVAAHGDRRIAMAVAAVGPVLTAVRYATDPSVTGSAFGPAPWLLAIVLLAVCSAAVAMGLLRRSELRAAALAAERLALEERDRTFHEERAAAAERSRISRDLHDVLAHSLTVVIGQTRVARFTPDKAPAALDVIEETARNSLRDLRRTLRTLRDAPSRLDPMPGLADLPALIERMQELGLAVHRRVTGAPRTLGPSTELALHRFAQEALTNAHRHGEGPLNWDETWEQHRLVITLRNAVPAHPHPAGGAGLGLRGMHERLAAAGGTLDIDRSECFLLRATVPCPQHPSGEEGAR